MLKRKKGDVAQVFQGNKFVEVPIEAVLDHLILTSQAEITELRKTENMTIPYIKERYLNNLQLKIKDNVPDTINMIKEELRNTIYTNNGNKKTWIPRSEF